MRPTQFVIALAGILTGVLLSADAGRAGEAVESVSVIEGWQQDDGSRMAAIDIRLRPGWHTYWRAPGGTGIAPVFDWSASGNLRSTASEWPRPSLFDSFGATAVGYEERLVLPVRLVPEDPSRPILVDLALSLGVCADICTQSDERVAAEIAPGAPEAGRAVIEAALAERARTPDEAGVARVTCRLVPKGKGYSVSAEITFAAPQAPGQLTVLESGRPDVWIGDAASRIEGRTLSAVAPVQAPAGAGPMLERGAMRVTVLDDRRAIDIRGCEAPG